METNQDRRIRKTKTSIQNALLTLMEKKKISDITVMELTELADVNRKTFYNHYDGIFAVLDEVENKCVDRIESLLKAHILKNSIESPALFFEGLIRELCDNEKFYMLLLQAGAHSQIAEKVMKREKEILRNMLPDKNLNEMWVDYFLTFISEGTVSVLKIWLLSNRQVSPETLADFFNTLYSTDDIHRFIEAAAVR